MRREGYYRSCGEELRGRTMSLNFTLFIVL